MNAKRDSEDISFYSKTQIRLSRIRYYPSFVLAICSCSIVNFIFFYINDEIFDKFRQYLIMYNIKEKVTIYSNYCIVINRLINR